MNKCKKCNVEMESGYTIVNDNIHGGLKIARQQRGFDNLKNKIYVEICPKCGKMELYSRPIKGEWKYYEKN